MASSMRPSVKAVFCALVCMSAFGSAMAFFKTNANVQKQEETEKYIEDLGLVGMVGDVLFDELKSYQWYFKLMTGYWLDKEMTVMVVSIVCNLIYCLSVVVGMFVFPQDTMLVYGVLTVFIGPALVLFGLGIFCVMLGAMALYPIISVTVLLVAWFFSTKLGQMVGTHLGMDVDGDQDVDLADFVKWLDTKLGEKKWMHLDKLYHYLQRKDKSPEQESIDKLTDTVEQLAKKVAELEAQLKKRS